MGAIGSVQAPPNSGCPPSGPRAVRSPTARSSWPPPQHTNSNRPQYTRWRMNSGSSALSSSSPRVPSVPPSYLNHNDPETEELERRMQDSQIKKWTSTTQSEVVTQPKWPQLETFEHILLESRKLGRQRVAAITSTLHVPTAALSTISMTSRN